MCRFRLDELRLDQRLWTCPKCGTSHDRDIHAARNLLTQAVRQLAGRDDRDLRVDAGDACAEEHILVQVLAEEARSGYFNRAGLERARWGWQGSQDTRPSHCGTSRRRARKSARQKPLDTARWTASRAHRPLRTDRL